MPVTDETDLEALVEIGYLLEVPGQFVEIVIDFIKNLRVRAEHDRRPMFACLGLHGQVRRGDTAHVFLGIQHSVAPHLSPKVLGKTVYHRGTNAVEPAGHLVGPSAELATGVQGRHHSFQCALAGSGMYVDRDAPAIVRNGNKAVRRDIQIDPGAVAGHCLVHCIVENFYHQVLQTAQPGGADVHAWADSYRLEALKHLNILCGIVIGGGGIWSGGKGEGLLHQDDHQNSNKRHHKMRRI